MKEYVISVDLGGTNVRVGIVKNDCTIVKVLREHSLKYDKEALGQQIIRMISSLNYSEYDIDTVGVSACGFVENGIITASPNLYINDFNLKKVIEEAFPSLTVKVVNDANATAFSESIFGSSKEFNSSFFITISSGIGGGFVYNHKLLNLPFEIGHTYIYIEHNYHEVEEYLSGNGIKRLCHKHQFMIENAKEFFELVAKRNSRALRLYDLWLEHVAKLIANIQIMYNVDCIVLSGGVMLSSSVFVEELKHRFYQYIEKFPLKSPAFVFAKFDQDAGLMGGAAVGFYFDK